MKRKVVYVPTYSQWDVLLASPTEPMPEASRRHQLTRMWAGLAAIERSPSPNTDDWRVCSDAVNLMESLITMGWAQDAHGLLADAVQALALAGKRHVAGAALRLDAAGIQAVRAVLEDYAAALAQLDHRTMLQVHRATERRIHAIHHGQAQAHDVEVMAL